MIEVGNIITLENNEEYLVLDQITYNKVKYIYSVRTIDNDNLTDEYLIFEVIKDNDGEFIKAIEDKKLYDELIQQFKESVSNKILFDDYETAE